MEPIDPAISKEIDQFIEMYGVGGSYEGSDDFLDLPDLPDKMVDDLVDWMFTSTTTLELGEGDSDSDVLDIFVDPDDTLPLPEPV